MENLSDAEKLSLSNYVNTWVPEIIKFRDMVKKDIKNAGDGIDKYLYYNGKISTESIPRFGGISICGLDWSMCQYPDSDGNDEGDPEKVKDFSEKISKMKPLFDKWKKEAKKFSPYFDLCLTVDEPDANYYFCNFDLYFNFKHIDKYGIVKPGLPEFKK